MQRRREKMKMVTDETLMRLLPRPPDSSEPAAAFISGLLASLTCPGVAADHPDSDVSSNT